MINKKNLGNLNKRMEKNSSGNGGSNFSVMDWKKSGNDELKFFKPVEGKNTIDIIPYEIKSKNHPMVQSRDSEIGDADYMLEVWQHSNIGPSKKTILCLNRMYGKDCPICEEAKRLRKNGSENEAKKLYAKQRAFYNVVDLSKDPDTVKVLDVSYKLFEKELLEEAKDSDDGFASFADPTSDGKSVRFRAEEESGGDFKFLKFKSFKFIDRTEDIPDSILKQAVSFDELIQVPTYDEVQAIFNGEDFAEDDDDEPKSKRYVEDDEDESPKKRSLEEDDDEPKAKSQSFDDMDDVDEAPKKQSADSDSCPCGHRYGYDNDEKSDCDSCKLWAKCSDYQEQLKKEGKL